MIKLLGKTVCMILRSHKWRRLRKAESAVIVMTDSPTVPMRICARCKIVRQVRQREAKAAA